MRLIKTSNADEMVLAFLKAEIDSERFKELYKQILWNSKLDEKLIHDADLSNEGQNHSRRELLKMVRGYSRNKLLFEGFPDTVQWHRVMLSKDDLVRIKYTDDSGWVQLTSGTRLVSDGANIELTLIDDDAFSYIRKIVVDLRKGKKYPDLILVAENLNSDLVVLEGHGRATAYVIALDAMPDEIEAILGCSEDIGSWCWY